MSNTMYVKTEEREAVENPAKYVRGHPELSIEELMEATGETEFYIQLVREVEENPALQRGGKANKQWHKQDRQAA